VPDRTRQRIAVELPWRTLLRVLVTAALVWSFFQISYVVLILIVAILLAVTLDPIVSWLEARKLPRWAAATGVAAAVAAIVCGFLLLTWSSLAGQWDYLVERSTIVAKDLSARVPAWMYQRGGGESTDLASTLGRYSIAVAQSAATALTMIVLGLVLTIYLLIEGRATLSWMLAFVPQRHRGKAEKTIDESRDVIFAYMKGNLITSIIATICTFVALQLLGVPAALLLALMAGLSDFVPVIGFIASSIPAVALALTVSVNAAVAVVIVYIVYNAVENYLISPWAYGRRMKLSDLAVILAFVVGAELAGVIGALIALPIAALYPTIERIWLRDQLPEETVREHRALQGSDRWRKRSSTH
jgi:predicted PurR-regulated permease PerM